jgi:hypothetical protein
MRYDLYETDDALLAVYQLGSSLSELASISPSALQPPCHRYKFPIPNLQVPVCMR